MSQTFSEKKNFLLKYSDCDNRATIADSDTSEDSVDEKNQKFKDKKITDIIIRFIEPLVSDSYHVLRR